MLPILVIVFSLVKSVSVKQTKSPLHDKQRLSFSAPSLRILFEVQRSLPDNSLTSDTAQRRRQDICRWDCARQRILCVCGNSHCRRSLHPMELFCTSWKNMHVHCALAWSRIKNRKLAFILGVVNKQQKIKK